MREARSEQRGRADAGFRLRHVAASFKWGKCVVPSMGAMAIMLSWSNAWARKFELLGSFGNVASSDGGEHCTGYSLALWKSDARVLGLLDIHQGLCGDPPCGVIQDASLDPQTGRFAFWSSIDKRWDFVGTLTADTVVGALNGERVRLERERDSPGVDFKPNQTLESWCEFWSGVRRCRGVRELCASLKPK
jgi:hypothetical protein